MPLDPTATAALTQVRQRAMPHSAALLDARRVEAFRTRIGAAVVTGYTDDVGWLDSAAVDLMLMSRLQRHRGHVDLALRGLRGDAEPLLDRLGFIVSPSTLQ